MVEACLRHVNFLDSEVAALDRCVAGRVLDSPEMRRLVQLPGVSATRTATLMAAVGDISSFASQRHLVGYLGLNPMSASRDPSPPSTAASRSAARPRCGAC
jgi:transposase